LQVDSLLQLYPSVQTARAAISIFFVGAGDHDKPPKICLILPVAEASVEVRLILAIRNQGFVAPFGMVLDSGCDPHGIAGHHHHGKRLVFVTMDS